MRNDPFNLIITGVGGQGNVLASQVLGRALVKKGLLVTIGETYGLSQRGGSVMSHIRVSEKRRMGPLIPKSKAHAVVGLEPIEVLRILPDYGNDDVVCIVNSRPVHPLGVIAGEREYPDLEEIKSALAELSAKHFWIDATDIAMRLGASIMTNVVMIGALAGSGLLPLSVEEVLREVETSFPESKREVNREAFAIGLDAVSGC